MWTFPRDCIAWAHQLSQHTPCLCFRSKNAARAARTPHCPTWCRALGASDIPSAPFRQTLPPQDHLVSLSTSSVFMFARLAGLVVSAVSFGCMKILSACALCWLWRLCSHWMEWKVNTTQRSFWTNDMQDVFAAKPKRKQENNDGMELIIRVQCKCTRQISTAQYLVQVSPLTNWVVGGTWGKIQQRSSSSLFCERPLFSSFYMGKDVQSLTLSIQHFICLPRSHPSVKLIGFLIVLQTFVSLNQKKKKPNKQTILSECWRGVHFLHWDFVLTEICVCLHMEQKVYMQPSGE